MSKKNPTPVGFFESDLTSKALSAGERHIHSSGGLGGSGLPLYIAKSAGIFEAEHRGPGFDHVGFKVESVETFKKDLAVMSGIDPANLAPRAASNISEHQVVLGLLQSCRYGQYQVPDPKGNYVDVSEQ